MSRSDWIGGYSANGDGSVTWHINDGDCCTSHVHDHHDTYPEEQTMTTRPTSKPKPHGFIRSVLIVAGLLAVGLVTRGYLRASSAPDSALATSGAYDIVAMLVIVAVAVAAVLLSKRRGRTRR